MFMADVLVSKVDLVCGVADGKGAKQCASILVV